MSQVCAPESTGRLVAGSAVFTASIVFLIVILVQHSYKPVLQGNEGQTMARDTPSLLFGVDVAAVSLAVVASFLLLLPELCCEARSKDDPQSRSDARRERCTGSVVLVVAVVLLSASARIRDVNLSLDTEKHPNQVCGSQNLISSCPTSRVRLSEAYQNYLKAEPVTCWLNTSSPSSASFNWGESLRNATVFPTSDFSDPDTYVKYPEYAKCFYWGCSRECNKESFEYLETMLKLEVALAVFYTGFAVVFMCVAIPEEHYAYVLPRSVPAVAVQESRVIL